MRFNIAVMSASYLRRLNQRAEAADDLELLRAFPRNTSLLLSTLSHSKSQLRQDLFVLAELDFKRGGFFVEFGATNGVDMSNTYLLEKDFAWKGILAEPARRWHNDLRNNRTCDIETNCVWRESNSLLAFNEVEVGEFSTIPRSTPRMVIVRREETEECTRSQPFRLKTCSSNTTLPE